MQDRARVPIAFHLGCRAERSSATCLRVTCAAFYTQPRIHRDWIRVAPPTAILCMALPAPLCVVTREKTLFSRFRSLSSRQQLTDSISLPVSPRFSSRLARLSYLARFVHDTGCAQRHTHTKRRFSNNARAFGMAKFAVARRGYHTMAEAYS